MWRHHQCIPDTNDVVVSVFYVILIMCTIMTVPQSMFHHCIPINASHVATWCWSWDKMISVSHAILMWKHHHCIQINVNLVTSLMYPRQSCDKIMTASSSMLSNANAVTTSSLWKHSHICPSQCQLCDIIMTVSQSIPITWQHHHCHTQSIVVMWQQYHHFPKPPS